MNRSIFQTVRWSVLCSILLIPAALRAGDPTPADLDAAIKSGDLSGHLTSITAWIDQKTPSDAAKMTESGMSELLKEPLFRNTLDQRKFIAVHGLANLNTFAKDETHRPFLAWILKNTQVMDLYLEAIVTTDGQVGDGAIDPAVLDRWFKLYSEDPDTRQGTCLRLAMAAALWPAGGRCTYRDEIIDWYRRFKHFKTAYQNKELVASFDHLLVWDYGKVLNSTASDSDLAWGRQMINTWRPDLRDKEQINRIVSEVWRRSSPVPFDNGYITVMEGGGKCGPRGAFGAFICQAFGIPAITVGQPAHYCFAARADFPEEEPQLGSIWKVYQGRGWHVSDCGGGMFGPAFVADVTKRYRTAELSLIAHLNWLAATLTSQEKAKALRDLAVKVRRPVNTSNPLGVPAYAVDVPFAGKAFKPGAPVPKDPEVDINKEGPSPSTAASNAAATPARVKEPEITVAPGVLYIKAETFSAKSSEVTVYDCYTGGKQINFHKSIKDSWVEYVVDVPAASVYSLEVMLAAVNRDMVLNVSRGAEPLGVVRVPCTQGLWKKMTPVEVKLDKGRQTLKISAPFQRGIAVRWLELTPVK